MERDEIPCNHDERFKGVLFTTHGCLACELEKMISKCERLETALKQYKLNYAEAIEVKHTVIEEINKAEAKIRELEERIQLAEATRDDALAYAKGYKSELIKWTSPHEDSELQEMKQQSQQASLSAKQAYINALEWAIKHREAKIKWLEEGIQELKDNDGHGVNMSYFIDAKRKLYKLIKEKP